MDTLQLFKEKTINNYLSSIDLSDISVTQIKSDLRQLLSEEPAVLLNYVNHQPLNEAGIKGKKVEKLDSLSITFTINKEILPGTEIPVPITKTFLLD